MTIHLRILLLIAAGCPSAAASTIQVQTPGTVPVNSMFSNVNIIVTPAAGESVTGFQFDLIFPSFLQANLVSEQGYFLANGISPLSPSLGTIDNAGFKITGISDALSGGDFLPGSDTVVTISFTALNLGAGNISIDPSSVTLTGPLDPVSGLPTILPVTTFDGAISVGQPTPEPASLLMCPGGLTLILALRRRRCQNASRK